ncbi:MAG: hypothetical protein HY706_14970, partial [Candidatus Hydrogenedentes bacterium]|nr:hypothetical protein [Candidatus Hydrogenedentota bacterium]
MLQGPGKRTREGPATSLSRLQWWVYSVPLFLKMLGIVVLVSMIFGGAVYYQVRTNIRRTHDQMHIQSATRAASLLAVNLERLDLIKDVPLVNQEIANIEKAFPDVSYVLILSAQQELLTYHISFTTEIPPDLPRQADQFCTACHLPPDRLDIPSDLLAAVTEPHVDASLFRRYARTMGSILDVTVPISGRDGAAVRLGYGDASIGLEMGLITDALIRSLIICIVIGQGLALVLTYPLVYPILNLVQVTK